MSEIVNLRLARKARQRAIAADQAQLRRLQFGRSRAERAATGQEQARAERVLDGAHRGTVSPEAHGD